MALLGAYPLPAPSTHAHLGYRNSINPGRPGSVLNLNQATESGTVRSEPPISLDPACIPASLPA